MTRSTRRIARRGAFAVAALVLLSSVPACSSLPGQTVTTTAPTTTGVTIETPTTSGRRERTRTTQEQQTIYLAFEKEFFAIEQPANAAVKNFVDVLNNVSKGKTTVSDATAAALKAQVACRTASKKYDEIDVPGGLSSDVENLLDRAAGEAADAYGLRAEAMGLAVDYLKNPQQPTALRMRSKLTEASKLISSGANDIVRARVLLGLPAKPERMKQQGIWKGSWLPGARSLKP